MLCYYQINFNQQLNDEILMNEFNYYIFFLGTREDQRPKEDIKEK